MKIKDGNNVWHDSEEEIEKEFLDYFSNIFLSSNPVMIEDFL